MADKDYIHGFTPEEQDRLVAQNDLVGQYIHERINLKDGSNVLEIGCGVGAQMIHILGKYPNLNVTGVDISEVQLERAAENLKKSGISKERYKLLHSAQVDYNALHQSFDSIVLIWVLEHTDQPIVLLNQYKQLLKPDGQIFVTEVFHSSFHVHPSKPLLMKLWQQSLDYQKELGGDADIGLRLGELLNLSGYKKIVTKPYLLFWDQSEPTIKLNFLNYWKGLLESAYKTMLIQAKASEEDWKMVTIEFKELMANNNSVFYYSFIQSIASRSDELE